MSHTRTGLRASPAAIAVHVVLLIVAWLALASPARATDRYFRDLAVRSPDGRLRLEARSPANAGATPAPWASDFTYTLYEHKTGRVVWTRKQPRDPGKGFTEGSPLGLTLDDAGRAGIRVAGDELVIVDSAGVKVGQVDLLPLFSADEHARYVAQTTAGPMWTSNSLWMFFDMPLEGGGTRTYFLVRPCWEHRIIVDAQTARVVEGDGPAARAVMTRAVEAEGRWAIQTLRAGVKHPPPEDDWKGWNALRTAVHIAGKQALRDAVMPLRDLETTALKIRGDVHLALRRLGERPRVGPVLPLTRWLKADIGWRPDHDHPLASAVGFEARAANAADVKVGLSVERLAELMGGPDAEFFDPEWRRHAIDYDLDSPTGDAGTLRVVVGMDNTVTHVRLIVPAVWRSGCARELGFEGQDAGR